MAAKRVSPRRNTWGSLWGISPTIFAMLLVLWAPRPGIWLDEAATISAASRSWGDLWLLTGHQDRALFGYYAITKAVADVAGCTPLSAGRGVSSISYIAAVFLVTIIAARLWGSVSADRLVCPASSCHEWA